MPHPFLSSEWITDARAIREKYADEVPEVDADLKINIVVSDVPFEEGVVECHLDTTSGVTEFELELLDDADVTVSTDYETAQALFVDQDPAIAMQAFMNGKVQVEGDMMKLMGMQMAMPTNEFTAKIDEEIKAITE